MMIDHNMPVSPRGPFIGIAWSEDGNSRFAEPNTHMQNTRITTDQETAAI